MNIRGYREDDATAVRDIFVSAVEVTGLRSYSPEQVAAWAAAGASVADTRARCADGRSVWVAADEHDTPIAFIDLEDNGHIDMLFCAPAFTGQGIAAQLYETLEATARAGGMNSLHVEASEVAKPFFARRGFKLLHRNDFTMAGTPIHNYAMEKAL